MTKGDMKTIHKYVLEEAKWTVTMPRGARILCVQAQHGKPAIWALVDPPDQDRRTPFGVETRTFFLFGTGHNIPYDVEKMAYVGTVQFDGGALVLHVFELRS